MSDVTIDMSTNSIEVHEKKTEPWKITMVDTGAETQTGGRLKRVAPYIGSEDFCMTYGDGVSSVHIGSLINFHKQHGPLSRDRLNPRSSTCELFRTPCKDR